MKILFWFRKSESKKQVQVKDPVGSIQCRITVQNVSIELGATTVMVRKSVWDPGSQIVTGDGTRSTKANKTLREISSRLDKLYDVLSTKYEYVSPSTVKEYYLSRKKFTYSITEIVAAFLAHRQKLHEQGSLSEATLNVDANYCRHILVYMQSAKISRPVEIPDSIFQDFYDWMIDKNRSGERFARKVCAFIRQILRWAIKKKLSPSLTAFAESLPGKPDNEEDLDTTHLSIAQLQKLLTFDFNTLVEANKITAATARTLSQERDAFAFNCFTGMHHCDYQKKEFKIEEYRGALFLKGKRKKTKKRFAIKLLEPAIRILNSYGNNLTQLPVKSNQKRNSTLKLIAVLLDLPVVLTTKIARKTFSDLALNEMLMSPDDVAACLGLTSTKYLKNYGRIREKRLMKVMTSWQQLKEAS